MTYRPRSPETGDDSDMAYDRESTTGVPRWVKVVGIIVALVALLVVVVMLVSGGGHSPRRHGSGGSGGQAPAGVTDVQAPPQGGPSMIMHRAAALARQPKPRDLTLPAACQAPTVAAASSTGRLVNQTFLLARSPH